MKNSSFPKIIVGLFVLAVLVAGVWMIGWMKVQSQNPGQSLPVLGTVDDFSLTERSGDTVSRADLKDNIWIADFIFTTCPGPCPRMSKRMGQLQTSLAAAPEVRLVSFTVDPERDTPEVLSRYADHYEADPRKWLFLTGDKGRIYDFARSSLNLSVREDPENTHIIHSTRFVLIDGSGQIRGYYDSMDRNALAQLVMDVQRLRREREL